MAGDRRYERVPVLVAISAARLSASCHPRHLDSGRLHLDPGYLR